MRGFEEFLDGKKDVYNKTLDGIEPPQADSPVLGTRHRRSREEAAEKMRAEATEEPGKSAAERLPATIDKSVPRPKRAVSPSAVFEKVAVRKGGEEKVRKLLEKQKKRAERLEKKKYRGFGETSKPKEKKIKAKKVELAKESENEASKKRSHVSEEEKNLFKELMKMAEDFEKNVSSDQGTKAVGAREIIDFEESQTLGGGEFTGENFDELF